jgi:putative transposase
MNRSRPGVLRAGDRIRLGGLSQTVTGFAGTLVRLADEHGATSVIHLPHLLADPGFEQLGNHRPSPLLPAGLLNAVPKDEIGRSEWWSRHIVEVITGTPPDAEGTRPRPEYDPATRPLTQRGQAKAAELTELTGTKISEHTVRRKRRRYQTRGIAGLIDWRAAPVRPARGRADARVVQALEQAIGEASPRWNGSWDR